MFTFVVEPADPRQRADKLVLELLVRVGHQTTRAEVQRWIDQGRVRLNGKACRRSTKVPVGAELSVEPGPPPLSEAEPDGSIELDVVFEDAHLLVVNKPAGLVVHPGRGHPTGTLVNGLLARPGFEVSADLSDPADAEGHLRPGIVHRLDKDTSGLLVVAKDPRAREGLKELFARHDIERAYLAIVVGRAKDGSYDTSHGRHPRSRLRFTSLLSPEQCGGRRAVTHVQNLEHRAGASLVSCRLETGRTHQIRVHLAEQARTPVLADGLYGQRPADGRLRQIAETLGRQALHAELLGFVHPVTGEPLSFRCPMPSDMRQAWTSLL